MTLMTNWAEATVALEAAQSIVIVSHIAPDGDAYGSMLGLGNALRKMGKQVDIAVDGGVLEFARFLPGSETIVAELIEGEWDLFISVDSSDEERTGKCGEYARAHSSLVINLDHHATNKMFGDIHLVDPAAVSATQVIYEWLGTMGLDLDRDVAIPLLAGLVTDTIGFRTSNVNARILQLAYELVLAGAPLAQIVDEMLDSRSFQEVALWNRMLETVKLRDNGIITAEVTRADMRALGISDPTDAGLVSFLIRVREAVIAAIFKETAEGKIELSFRSKPGFDVAAVAFELGGGGHKQAAGATIEGPMEAARERVLPLLRNAAKMAIEIRMRDEP